MVIEKLTGGKHQEVRKAEQSASENKRADSVKEQRAEKGASSQESGATYTVSDRSKAAIKAYRIASEVKPNISRAQRIGQLKAQIANGTYQADSGSVADAVLKSIVKEG